ncbi:MAG: nucleoside-diphosphate sugar epimerase/dehydratase [Hyphomicrobiaceae bacterium]
MTLGMRASGEMAATFTAPPKSFATLSQWVPAMRWIIKSRDAILDQPRSMKRILLIANDFILSSLAIWMAFSLRPSRLYVPETDVHWLILLAAPFIVVACFHFLGLYRLVTRFLGRRGAFQILLGVILSVLIWALLVFLVIGTGNPSLVVPRAVPLIFGATAFVLLWGSRELASYMLLEPKIRAVFSGNRRNIVIYGAGAAGVQLLEALRRIPEYRAVGFVEDKASVIGQHVHGLKVYRVDKLPRLIERDGVREVLLAVADRPPRERREVIKRLTAQPVLVKTMPSIEDIASGRVAVTDLKPIDVADLLGRDTVPPDAALLSRAISGKNVMVTGAGGSIGSELVRQILRQGPRSIVLLELSEPSLYLVEMEIRDLLARPDMAARTPEVHAVLGSVLDADLVKRTIERHAVQTIYHAAAYKHVPIVEANPVIGLRNNTFGTAIVAELAAQCRVERVALISTDKAVRPTNIMGASKRLAEQVFQAAAHRSPGTIYSMVRFGNVLGSSGSVVQRFKQQIEQGGPVTVTHRDIIRYFMSIPEAAALVIQASAMAKGGEVFVLDMGEPVKIDELARTMIRLMGLEPQDEETPDGDIAIKYVGLRPGEKLYEELLIDEQASATEHPRIHRNSEPYLPPEKLRLELEALKVAMNLGDIEAIDALLLRTVEGYRPDKRNALPGPSIALTSRTLH